MKKSTRRPKITLVEEKKNDMTNRKHDYRQSRMEETILLRIHSRPKNFGSKLCLFFIGKENFIKRKIEKVKNAPMGTQAVY